MRTLIAKKALVYAGRNYAPGEELRVLNGHCVTLIATGLAADREASAPKPPAPPPKPPATPEPAPPPRRTYRRRDLTPERD